MRTPSSALPAWPHGLLDGRGMPLADAAAFFLGASFTTFLADFFAAALADLRFLRVAILVPLEKFDPYGRLFLTNHALRVEVADAAALGAGGRIDHRVDEGRLAGIHRRLDGATELVGRRHVGADAAEGFRDLVVARAFDERGRRRIRAAGGIDVGAAIDAVVVEDDDADRQLVAADRLDFHAAEAEGAVAFDREHRLAGLDRGGDPEPPADAHDAPGADVEALARLVHVDHAAREIERIGAFVDENRVRPLFDDLAQRSERAVIIHRRGVLHQPRRHLGDVFLLLGVDRRHPVGRRRRPR